jgi:FtsZ-binding cell division protein ZapB
MAKKKRTTPRITSKEKNAPAYRKKLEQEIVQLKESLETTQNQASTLQQQCSDLEKENSVLDERLKGSGFQSTVKDICILIAGAGISYFVEGQHKIASTLLLVSFVGVGVYWLISNFRKK